MQREHWIFYHLENYHEVTRGWGEAGSAPFQPIPDGCGMLVVPFAVVMDGPINVEAMRVAMAAFVDASADRFCLQFATPGQSQGERHRRKEAEARAWLLDDTVPTPFLTREAAERDIPMATLAAEVIASSDVWTANVAPIEGKRVALKRVIAQAQTYPEIIALGLVDWQAVLSPSA